MNADLFAFRVLVGDLLLGVLELLLVSADQQQIVALPGEEARVLVADTVGGTCWMRRLISKMLGRW